MTVQQTTGMANRPVVTIKLASTSDELMQCYMLRAAVFMGEQQCPYWEEFDGNDYTASHLMLYVDGEPAGVHAGALVRELRQARARHHPEALPLDGPVHSVRRMGQGFCRKKGYPRPTCIGQQRLWPIFETQGFRKVNDKVFHFSDHEYGAFVCDLGSTRRPCRRCSPIPWC